MFLISMAFQAVVAPALICGMVFWLLNRLLPAGRLSPTAPPAVALGSGYLAGHWFAVGLPSLPPVGTTQWMFLLVAAAALLSFRDSRTTTGRSLPAALVFLALVTVLARPMFQHHWSLPQGIWITAGLAAGLLLAWWSLNKLDSAGYPPLVSGVFTVSAAAASAVLGLSATSLLAQLAMGLSACLAVLTFLSWKKQQWTSGWLAVGLAAIWGLVLSGRFYAEVTTLNAFLVLASPLAAWVGFIGRSRESLLLRVVTGVSAAGVILLPALVLSYLAFVEASAAYEY